ncbi:MAG: GNAT family N-acetyltransferase [Candidatus Caenarcaniphilales bacterium]|nr:GNAT family N-acetyltransferase [Candidatus Caenarcaniphilales bacterium]
MMRYGLSQVSFREIKTHEFCLLKAIAHEAYRHNYADFLTEADQVYLLEKMYDPDRLQKLAIQGQTTRLISVDHQPQGYITVQDLSHNLTYIDKLYFRPEAQGKGLGSLLLDRFLEDAWVRGIRKAFLYVNQSNSAKDFYLKYGFRIEQAIVRNLGKLRLPDYRMTLVL